MSSHYHAIVWIDHHEAKVFQFDASDVDTAYLQQVARALQHAGMVLITGPAGAKKELAREFFVADDRMRSQLHS